MLIPSLKLQAYDGWDIPNGRDVPLGPGVIELARRALRRHISRARQLQPPSEVYNCHGLVFASRRTNIPPPNMPNAVDIGELLRRDRYERITPPPQVGDIIVYRQEDGSIGHTGFVSRVDTLGNEAVVFVWSMWGGLGEYEHLPKDSPYHECRLEYWRLRA